MNHILHAYSGNKDTPQLRNFNVALTLGLSCERCARLLASTVCGELNDVFRAHAVRIRSRGFFVQLLEKVRHRRHAGAGYTDCALDESP